MWNRKTSLLSKMTALLLIVLLLMLVLMACDDDDDDEETTSPAGQNTTTTAIPVDDGPVKIGVITGWSGPTAMIGSYLIDPIVELIEWEWNEQRGGILGGREVEFIKYDDGGGSVPGALEQATKALHEKAQRR